MFNRAYTADLEVRSGSDGRTVHGIAVPFDSPTTVDDGWGVYEETFRMGAFKKTLREQRLPDGSSKVKFLANHDRIGRFPLGRATLLEEQSVGLYGEFRVSKTPDGDAALELIRDGVIDAFSVGFQPVKEREDMTAIPPKVERLEVKLPEVSGVAFPAYAGALIAGVRSQTGMTFPTRQQLEELLEMFERGLDLDQILRQLTSPEGSTEPEGTPDGAADLDTPDEEPSTPPPAVDEPPEDPEAADSTSSQPRHSLPYTPAQRPVMTRESRRSRIGRVQALLAQAQGAE
jgi:uncharacterized protein